MDWRELLLRPGALLGDRGPSAPRLARLRMTRAAGGQQVRQSQEEFRSTFSLGYEWCRRLVWRVRARPWFRRSIESRDASTRKFLPLTSLAGARPFQIVRDRYESGPGGKDILP